MNTDSKHTADQLRLAADILEHNHPWKTCNGETWWKPEASASPAVHVVNGQHIRPILATPPDGRPLHNPDNLTTEQVGLGYRLTLGRDEWKPKQEYWSFFYKAWKPSACFCFGETYRLPLSVPWPEEKPDPYAALKKAHAGGKVIQSFNRERGIWQDCPSPAFEGGTDYRIKPDEETLPPSPPGIKWHREDGWKPGDLPTGYRPLVEGEESGNGTQQRYDTGWVRLPNSVVADAGENPMRTRRPLTFTHAGKQWTYHRPGDPMPCRGDLKVEVILKDANKIPSFTKRGDVWIWHDRGSDSIIGWRYAEPETKEVELGPEDVPPGSAIYEEGWPKGTWEIVTGIERAGVRYAGKYVDWEDLQPHKINRSLSKGQWNPNAWEPCKKTINL